LSEPKENSLTQIRVERCAAMDLDEASIRAWRAEMIAPERAGALSAVFKALCDPTRLRLISLLVRQEFCVGDLAAVLDVSQSVVSHQLRDMRRMGWVRNRREGRHVFYILDDEHVRSLFEKGLAHTQDQ
jgi:ArsR family transcriptional regulator